MCESLQDERGCDLTVPVKSQCEEIPFAMVMRHGGGNCEQSENIQGRSSHSDRSPEGLRPTDRAKLNTTQPLSLSLHTKV